MRLYEWKNTNLRQRRSVQGQIQERDLVGAMNPPQGGFHISTWLNVSSADQVSLILNSTSHWSKDAETETPILWPPYVKSRLTGKDPEAGKDWGQEEKGVMEDGMVGCHHWLIGMSLSKLQKIVKYREAQCEAVYGVAKSSTWLNNWSTTITYHEGWFLISSLIELYPGSLLSQGLLFNQIFLLN